MVVNRVESSFRTSMEPEHVVIVLPAPVAKFISVLSVALK